MDIKNRMEKAKNELEEKDKSEPKNFQISLI